ncbi:MAG: hypothetical protein EOO05_13035 [Chitinophagaceae bacterium]|nr:MAG: hypothetical protein EOO05_13035 [Chitinophagaceae bacterium]
MNLEYKSLLDNTFHPSSRVWIYQSNRVFSLGEALSLEQQLDTFAGEWKTHGTPVKAAGYLFFGQFIVLMADETAAGVSGCSTDSSVRFIKELEKQYGVSLFDRTALAFVVKDRVQVLPLAHLQYSVENGFIGPDTLYFNHTVLDKTELENNWIIPLKNSWLARKLPSLRNA